MTPWEEGSPSAPIAFLGEAPGGSEMAAGQPLVGPAGRLFDTCLNGAAIPRRHCYILNLWPYKVRKNREGNVFYSPEGEIVWNKGKLTEEGLEDAQSALQKLSECSARVVCPMGGPALAALLGPSRPIMKWRGSILWSDEIRKKIMPTIHPAASLRGQYVYRYTIIGDMKRVKEESISPDLDLPKRNLITRPSFDDVMAYLEAIVARKQMTALDIEIYNHEISCLSFSTNPSEAMSVPFIDEYGHYFTEEQELEIWLLIERIVSDPDIALCNQNLAFDLAVIYQRQRIVPRGYMADCMVAHSIMYPDFPKGLDFIASVHTREPYWKDEGKIWSKMDVSWDEHWAYNAKDSVVALECWDALADEMDDEYLAMHDFTTAMYPALIYMMVRGVKVDAEQLAAMGSQVETDLAAKVEELKDVADYEFNPNSPKQCVEYFYHHKGIRAYTSRKTGSVTTDDTAMARIVRRHNLPEARLVQEIRNLRKLKSTYLEVEFDHDGRLRCSYNPRGTRFSRLSSSETVFGTGLNFQNLDPRMKGFLVAG